MAQIITIIRGCATSYFFFRIWKFEFLANFWKFFGLDLEKKSTVVDGFFPYLAQMITSMRGYVAYNDLWPWPISSRSFGLGLENRVHSVSSTVCDGFFPYLVQMITSMRRCVACDGLWPWPKFSRSFDLDFENHVRSVTFSVLDRLFPYLPQIITTIRGCVTCYSTVVLIKFLLYSGARAGADSPAPLALRRWRRLPTGAGNFTPLAAELSRCPPELFFTAGTTLIAARALVYGNPTRAPVKSSSVMPQVCVNELDQHWFREWLVAYSAPSHYLNQCWGYCHCQLNP